MNIDQAIYILRNTAWLGSNDERDETEQAVETVVNELERRSWIPCSERLPENEGRYLVTNNRIGAWIVDFDFYDSFNKKWYYNQDVVAWMLPIEPHEERKEQ